MECPKSYIKPESLGWIEEYNARKHFGFGNIFDLDAKSVDAFRVLDSEREKERANAE